MLSYTTVELGPENRASGKNFAWEYGKFFGFLAGKVFSKKCP